MKSKNIIVIASIIVALVLALSYIYIKREKDKNKAEMQEFVDLQKKSLEEELSSLQSDFEAEYNKLRINNGEISMYVDTDSLLNQLMAEKNKVESLKAELREYKNASASQISKLNKEVGTLKTLLKSYIVQVDSLHTMNKKLIEENKEVKASYVQMSERASSLEKEKEDLNQKVNLAARLDASAIKVTFLDSRGKSTNKVFRIKKFAISFIIPRNVTAAVGNKTIFARLQNPNNELMTQAGHSATFGYENKNLDSSISKSIEYNGEDTNVTMYYNVEDSLLEGEYRLSLFADGNMIGRLNFTIN